MAQTQKDKDPQGGQAQDKNRQRQDDQESSNPLRSNPDTGVGGRADDQNDPKKREMDEQRNKGGGQDEMPKDQVKRNQP
jgi:hypothetical protein